MKCIPATPLLPLSTCELWTFVVPHYNLLYSLMSQHVISFYWDIPLGDLNVLVYFVLCIQCPVFVFVLFFICGF